MYNAIISNLHLMKFERRARASLIIRVSQPLTKMHSMSDLWENIQ